MAKTSTLIRTIALKDGKSDLQWNIERGDDTILVDPFPDGLGWYVLANNMYVGDIVPVNPAENHKVTPLAVRLRRDVVRKNMNQATFTENAVSVIADHPAMAVGFVKRMI